MLAPVKVDRRGGNGESHARSHSWLSGAGLPLVNSLRSYLSDSHHMLAFGEAQEKVLIEVGLGPAPLGLTACGEGFRKRWL